MKTKIKKLFRLAAGCAFACCLSFFTQQTFAIEGLKVAVVDTNAVLSWPSDYTSSDTFLIQSRSTLSVTDSWATLSDNVYPDYGTNITYFIDPNGVTFPPVVYSGTNGGGSIDPGSTNSSGGSGTNSFLTTSGFYRVVRDGAHLFGLTNDTVLSGIVRIPVELANSAGDITTISLTENQTQMGNSIQTAPLNYPLALIVDTTLMSNGVHQISCNALWSDTNGGLWEAVSPTVSVTVSNEISFENWVPTFGETGDTFLFRATSMHTNTDWIVSVYNYTNGYLGYFNGHTYDGDISFYYDYSGTSLTNNPVFHFEISTEYIDPPAPPTYKASDPWTATGRWAAVCQHAWDDASNPEILYEMLNGFVGVGQGNGGVSPTVSSDGSPYALTYDTGSSQGDTDWANFRTALFGSTTRNLLYFGHGGPTGFGANTTHTNRFISATEIAATLHTIPAGQTNRHAFRFVFADGCSTAVGTLPESFGILHRENVPGIDYYNSSTRYSTFVGWPSDKYIGVLDGHYIHTEHVEFIQAIQSEMLFYSRTIKDAIIHASHYAATHDDFGEESMKVFGYWDMTIGAHNN